MSTYCYITQRAGQVLARQLCQVLRVVPATCCAWQCRQQASPVNSAWLVAVHEYSIRNSQHYGKRRLRARAQAGGHAVGR